MCASRAIQNQVMLTFANYGYLDMLVNWVYNVSLQRKMTNYVIVSLDRDTYNALNGLGIGTCHFFQIFSSVFISFRISI